MEKEEENSSISDKPIENKVASAFSKLNTNEKYINKSRTLILSSRGVTTVHRHLLLDIFGLMPHAKKESKIEKKDIATQISELCIMHTCSNVLYFEAKKKRDLYLWIGSSPKGPSIKFHVENIHTSHELKLTGNCLKGSRPILSFDAGFEQNSHFKLMKESIISCFNVPEYHPKSKPFIDHVLSFIISDGKIWFRNYQIVKNIINKTEEKTELYEIGPRLVLNPILILDGAFNGLVLYQNPIYKSPSKKRIEGKRKAAVIFKDKLKKKKKRERFIQNIEIPQDEIDKIFEENDSN